MRKKEVLLLQILGELFSGKQGLVELARVNSTRRKNTSGEKRLVCKAGKKRNLFVLKKKLNDKFCRFKLDTGFNVLIVSAKLVDRLHCRKLTKSWGNQD